MIVREVFHTLAYALPEEERRLLADALPDDLGTHLTEGRIETAHSLMSICSSDT